MAATNIIESFFVALGFQVDSKGLDEMKERAAAITKTMLAVVGAATAATVALGAFVTHIAQSIDTLGDFAERESVAIETIQELGHAAKISGSSIEAVQSSIQGVNRIVGDVVIGMPRAIKLFERLGLSAKRSDGSVKNFDDILSEVADKMQGMSRQAAIAMAEKLGIDRSLIPLLLRGRAAISALREEARAFGVVTQADADAAGALTDSLDRTKFLMGALTNTIAVRLMPTVTRILDGFRDWILLNRKWIETGITTALKILVAVTSTFWDWINRIVSAGMQAVAWLFQFKAGIWLAVAAVTALIGLAIGTALAKMVLWFQAVRVALVGFSLSALLIPIAIGVMILAIGLLIDDLVNWYEGNESVIGDILEAYPNAGKVVAVALGVMGAAFIALKWEAISTFTVMAAQALANSVTMIRLSAAIVGGYIPLIAMYASLAVAAVSSAAAAALAWLVTIAPIALVLLAIAAVGVAVYLLWTNWDTVSKWIGGKWDWLTGKVQSFVDLVRDAASALSSAFSGIPSALSSAFSAVPSAVFSAFAGAPSGLASASANNSLNATGGVIGSAGSTSNSSSTTQTTITGTTINVNSPDPAKAGKAVRLELERMHRKTTRNGLSGVGL